MSSVGQIGSEPVTPASELFGDPEGQEMINNLPPNTDYNTTVQSAQPQSSNDSCMGDFLSILKLIIPIATTAMG